ncbi:BirA family transcriptional regulator, biotin operon repressor / biotin-[acetyl-CoA-carboxylase] ligase [Halogeometricum rufum]|uniref:BirA family transcriptional regulator, biotin operon repressor / biotin-[acetyl-CoA-carboxylase] ligase n=1 Tax=Halogeometricum rufum TaxID=553469 RepID=A0A1I6HQ65_9EURY|nr:biotin--[acetyl-CoA-carboxylase] ligase [Halogeometricum rufum]SFR56595.1 BirA family transcriptional regulator, biotin operon repressor / biotin-[acetyl-CoA-carboxylase] ligase [Halogeometricum rufum]
MNETRRALLAALADGPTTGPELAERLGVSRAAVWKQVEALREAGFGIESGDDGYRVTDVPAYGAAAVEFGLDAPYEVEFHDAVGSTNDRGRELAAAGAADVVVVADEQTGSRGRLKREWTAPAGGVWASLVLRPEIPPAHAPLYTLAAAVAVTRAAREAGVDASIKWPNDVLVREPNEGTSTDGDGVLVSDDRTDRGGRKLAGVLTEMEGEADRVSWLVVGIGVNANVDGEALPPGATSIRDEVGDVDRRVFLQRVLETFDELTADPEAILSAWRECAATLGQRVRVETPNGVVEGEAVDVRVPGALVVRTDEGERVVHAGDCEHLRPAR